MKGMKVTLDGDVYLSASDTREELGLPSTTLAQWVESGAVRSLRRQGRRIYVCVEDARTLRDTPPREGGVARISAEQLARQRRFVERMQEKTSPAEHHREIWGDYDVDKLEATDDVLSAAEQARALGRTYLAVLSARSTKLGEAAAT
jgi:predicted site-specific integrase-resolvase